MTRDAASLRVGCVKYLNARPLIHGWSGRVVFDHPAALCEKLAAGELDVALVSSFEFLRNPSYAIVDGVAIASDGPVYSVIIAAATELSDLQAVELDPASVTSVNLLRCMLGERGVNPKFGALFDADAPLREASGRLLIGDQAIRFRQSGANCQIFDLGELWRAATGLPFVFALWLVRPQVQGARAMAERLRTLRDANLAQLDALAAGADFPRDFCLSYWRDYLKYRFGDREKAGLLAFRSLCEKHGILPPNPAPLSLV